MPQCRGAAAQPRKAKPEYERGSMLATYAGVRTRQSRRTVTRLGGALVKSAGQSRLKDLSSGRRPLLSIRAYFLLIPQLMLRVADATGDEAIMSDNPVLSDVTDPRQPRRIWALEG